MRNRILIASILALALAGCTYHMPGYVPEDPKPVPEAPIETESAPVPYGYYDFCERNVHLDFCN